jgi:cytochrome c biogenesis protein ResB
MNGAKRLSLTVWRSLTSARLTVLLTAALLVAFVVVSLLPQLPSDSAVLVPSLQPAALRYRQTTRLIQLLGLFEAFRAPWYLVLVAGLLLNLVACTAKRLPRLWPFLAGPPTTTGPEESYHSHVRRQEWPVCSLQEWLEALNLVLRVSPCRHRRYTEHDESAKCACLFSARGRWSQTGTMVSRCHRGPGRRSSRL